MRALSQKPRPFRKCVYTDAAPFSKPKEVGSPRERSVFLMRKSLVLRLFGFKSLLGQSLALTQNPDLSFVPANVTNCPSAPLLASTQTQIPLSSRRPLPGSRPAAGQGFPTTPCPDPIYFLRPRRCHLAGTTGRN